MPRRIAQERVPRPMSGRVIDMGLPAHTSHPLSRLFACFAGPIPGHPKSLLGTGIKGQNGDQGTGQISRIETPNSERRPGIKLIRSLVYLGRLHETAEQDTQGGQRRNRNDAREVMNETNSRKTAALV